MKKNERITTFVQQLGGAADSGLDPHYLGYFTCFNAQEYYEAHDVLEHLWLRTKDDNHLFFKGLIQVAGSFVHLQKQFLHPEHPKHARRLNPAVRLFRLAVKNLEPYAPVHMQLDVAALLRLCERHMSEILHHDYQRNPWSPTQAPVLELLPA